MPQDDEAPSPWSGVVLVTMGVLMMLLPIVALFTGVRPSDEEKSRLEGDAVIGTRTVGMIVSLVLGPGIVAAGVAELRKAPPQYRLRTLLIAMTVVAMVLGLVTCAIRALN